MLFFSFLCYSWYLLCPGRVSWFAACCVLVSYMPCKRSVKVGSVGKVGTNLSISYTLRPRVRVGYFARDCVSDLLVPQRKNLYLFFAVLQLCELFQGASRSF